jgi:hypothetical protein
MIEVGHLTLLGLGVAVQMKAQGTPTATLTQNGGFDIGGYPLPRRLFGCHD